LPRTDTGKVLRRRVLADLLEQVAESRNDHQRSADHVGS
jgi:hypothetical protein